MTKTVADSLYLGRTRLDSISDAPAFEARQLVAYVLQQEINWLYANPEYVLTKSECNELDSLLNKRLTGYPLAYMLGKWGFYHWDFMINEHVLIPRQETELLVEDAIHWGRNRLRQKEKLSIVDVGTGSGIIAISMALSIANASVTAVDISQQALNIAQENAKRLGASHIAFQQSNLLGDVSPQKFDLILANLPYIEHDEMLSLRVSKYEPHLALDGGDDGLDLIKILLQQANHFLAEDGVIYLEIGANQSSAVKALVKSKFLRKCEVHVHQDLGGHDRIVKIVTAH